MLKDAFICHASEDKGLARSLWLRLAQYGVTSWLDEAEMNPGDILVQKIASAIHTSGWFVAPLTPSSVAKKWVTCELNQAMDGEARDGRTFIIPVVADGCEVPEYLRNKLYVDIRQRTAYEKGIASLIRTIRSDTHLVPPDYVHLDSAIPTKMIYYDFRGHSLPLRPVSGRTPTLPAPFAHWARWPIYFRNR